LNQIGENINQLIPGGNQRHNRNISLPPLELKERVSELLNKKQNKYYGVDVPGRGAYENYVKSLRDPDYTNAINSKSNRSSVIKVAKYVNQQKIQAIKPQ